MSYTGLNATARRTWLFADSPQGATANAALKTLIESAKANDLDKYEYLNYLLREMQNKTSITSQEILDQFLPCHLDYQMTAG